jgi:hypothetical protein
MRSSSTSFRKLFMIFWVPCGVRFSVMPHSFLMGGVGLQNSSSRNIAKYLALSRSCAILIADMTNTLSPSAR